MRALTLLFGALLLSLAPACAGSPEREPARAPLTAPTALAPPTYQASFHGAPAPVPVTSLNAVALHALRTTPCAPEEVAPGVWVSFDCSPHEPLRRAFVAPPRSAFSAGPLPAFVDHRLSGTEGPVKNQGAVGACTAFSLSTAMENAIRRMGRPDVLSALHIWSKYGTPTMGRAGDQTVEERITLEPTWPYDPVKACKLTRQPLDSCGSAYGVASGTGALDPRLRAEQAMADAGGRYRLVAVEELRTGPGSGQEIAAVIAGGDDIWASFHIDRAAWKNRAMTNGVIPDYSRRDNTGHAVVLSGYRTVGATRQFLIHNSWSERWGERGYAWISEAMIDRQLRSAYRVRVADAGGAGPSPSPPLPAPPGFPAIPGLNLPGSLPVPLQLPKLPPQLQLPQLPQLPQPQPQPGACSSGQVRDLMTGQCMQACPGGAPPVGGMCVPVLPFPG
jgi:hypothetical protein